MSDEQIEDLWNRFVDSPDGEFVRKIVDAWTHASNQRAHANGFDQARLDRQIDALQGVVCNVRAGFFAGVHMRSVEVT